MSTAPTPFTADDSAAEWKDRKRHLWLLGLIPPTSIFLAMGLVAGFNAIGHGFDVVSPVWWWIGPLLVYVLLPILDVFFGPDGSNPPEELMEQLENDKYYRYCTYVYIPFQLASLVMACYLWTADDLSWLGIDGGLGLASKIGLALSIGAMGGIGINTAHELGHKKDDLERWLSKITLAQTFYGHFYIEHNRGHHVRVATPEDPASSRFGESFWRFLPRSVWGSLTSSVELERKRLERAGKPFWHPSNDVLNAWAMSIVLWGALTAIFGWEILPFLVIQAVYGFSLLETVNYLEHYGLLRQKTRTGRYERCTPEHSWNSDHICTNIFLYHLQRHSDHHANPTRRYQTLRSFDGAPNLPSGYASMITLAYFPPIWRRVMDKRVLDHYDGDVERINIAPHRRERVLAEHGVSPR
ncbi:MULTISPECIES: alkane 1-monooxygenase [Gordonia]|uniref:Alkane 1-monooxygenase n=1 Tax=Gordonia hongkongensis TaxID=1701090 RepID=A0ABT6BY20_9ACTN|nr:MULTISPECIES: alkane 1-monooxygenase [Gordonia]MBN0971692.1 alkane 1-monooxygenase [Gordonia sp. BP-119]MBN0981174.1 alkane 1-monooxygenase [Gordonia sp. BP-94]MDF6101964.1 alkane 1-monooxygenase [Gordonia hongkongensis]UPG66692.1 alkane 1-monooxygenase [Gordonia hongkongensis]